MTDSKGDLHVACNDPNLTTWPRWDVNAYVKALEEVVYAYVESDDANPAAPRALSCLNCFTAREINVDQLRSCSYEGLPVNCPAIRAVVWKLLLNYLPPAKNEWERVLRQKRLAYAGYLREFVDKPHLPRSYNEVSWLRNGGSDVAPSPGDLGPPSPSPRSLSRDRALATWSPQSVSKSNVLLSDDGTLGVPAVQVSTSLSDPSITSTSTDLEIYDQVNKDVFRTRADISFFTDSLSKWAELRLRAKSSPSEGLDAARDLSEDEGSLYDPEPPIEAARDLMRRTTTRSARGGIFVSHAAASKSHCASAAGASSYSRGSISARGFLNAPPRKTQSASRLSCEQRFACLPTPQCPGDVLGRILFIYAKLHPSISYVQGMNELAAPIYFTLLSDPVKVDVFQAEVDTFFVFSHLMYRDGHLNAFCKGLDADSSGVLGRVGRFSALLQRVDPEVSTHLKFLGVEPQFYALRWLLLLLTQEFSLSDTLVLWDALIADGSSEEDTQRTSDDDEDERVPLVYLFCLAIVRRVRSTLLAGDFTVCLKQLQRLPSFDPAELLAEATRLRFALAEKSTSSSSNLQNFVQALRSGFETHGDAAAETGPGAYSAPPANSNFGHALGQLGRSFLDRIDEGKRDEIVHRAKSVYQGVMNGQAPEARLREVAGTLRSTVREKGGEVARTAFKSLGEWISLAVADSEFEERALQPLASSSASSADFIASNPPSSYYYANDLTPPHMRGPTDRSRGPWNSWSQRQSVPGQSTSLPRPFISSRPIAASSNDVAGVRSPCPNTTGTPSARLSAHPFLFGHSYMRPPIGRGWWDHLDERGSYRGVSRPRFGTIPAWRQPGVDQANNASPTNIGPPLTSLASRTIQKQTKQSAETPAPSEVAHGEGSMQPHPRELFTQSLNTLKSADVAEEPKEGSSEANSDLIDDDFFL